jgi:hypothetical protein
VRYDTTKNRHLDEISLSHPEIFKKWQEPLTLRQGEITHSLTKIKPSEEIKKILINGLLEKHLGDKQAEDYPHLDSYSKNPQEIEKYLKEVDGLSKQLQKRTVGKEREQKQRLDIEKALLELLSLNLTELRKEKHSFKNNYF